MSETTPAAACPRPSTLLRVILWVQAVYFTLTGVWPLVSLDTFEMVTGPKTDHWLVQTVGALITIVGLVLVMTAWRGRLPGEVVLLAVGSAVVLTAVDVIFVSLGVIPPIFSPTPPRKSC
jgi:hypothetical protein